MIDQKQYEEILNELGAPAHLEVLSERQDLLRFGASRVTYQHSEERLMLRAKLIRNGRAAWGTIGTQDRAAVASLRQRLEAAMPYLPVSEEQCILRGPVPMERVAQTYFPSTANMVAQDRIDRFAEATESLPRGTELGGSIVHSVVEHTVGNSRGAFRAETRTRAMIQLIGALEGRSAYARRVHRDASVLEIKEALASVRAGLAFLPEHGLSSGVYRAVLAPTAVITLLATFGQTALTGRLYASGASGVAGRMGEQVASPLVNLVDDGCDEAGLPSTFDCDGAPKQRVALIHNGTLTGLVHDDSSARQAGIRSTGHAVPPAWRFGAGPSPSHLLLASGDASEQELITECGTGVYIQRVDYVRVVQPKQTLVTGSTRDATLWIEQGKVAARLPQFRFTLKLTDLFAAVMALGKRRERGETVFMESVVAPAILVSGFPVDAVVQA